MVFAHEMGVARELMIHRTTCSKLNVSPLIERNLLLEIVGFYFFRKKSHLYLAGPGVLAKSCLNEPISVRDVIL